MNNINYSICYYKHIRSGFFATLERLFDQKHQSVVRLIPRRNIDSPFFAFPWHCYRKAIKNKFGFDWKKMLTRILTGIQIKHGANINVIQTRRTENTNSIQIQKAHMLASTHDGRLCLFAQLPCQHRKWENFGMADSTIVSKPSLLVRFQILEKSIYQY